MDFVDFCTTVFKKVIEAEDSSSELRAWGVARWNLARAVFGEAGDSGWRSGALVAAIDALHIVGLLDFEGSPARRDPNYVHASSGGRALVNDLTPLWRDICQTEIDGEHAALLRILNRKGFRSFEDCAYPDHVEESEILTDEAWTGDKHLLAATARDLERANFIQDRSSIGFQRYCPTYQSLVWETRCALAADAGDIDALVEEGETPTLDLKRQLAIDTASQRAELVKDVIALANTRGEGGRYLIIGFSDDGDYYDPSDPAARVERDRLLKALTQDRLQTIIANYVVPIVRIKYREVAYRLGPVGKLEVVRDPTELPYTVGKSIGSKEDGQHRVEAGDAFIRVGTVTRRLQPEEIEQMKGRAEQLRSKRAQRT